MESTIRGGSEIIDIHTYLAMFSVGAPLDATVACLSWRFVEFGSVAENMPGP